MAKKVYIPRLDCDEDCLTIGMSYSLNVTPEKRNSIPSHDTYRQLGNVSLKMNLRYEESGNRIISIGQWNLFQKLGEFPPRIGGIIYNDLIGLARSSPKSISCLVKFLEKEYDKGEFMEDNPNFESIFEDTLKCFKDINALTN